MIIAKVSLLIAVCE